MDANSVKFRVTPRILKADAKQTITIEGLDESTKLYDDVDYTVSISAKDDWKYKAGSPCLMNDRMLTETFTLRSKNGVIYFEYFFEGEHEWRIRISREDITKHLSEFRAKTWPYCLSYWRDGIEFCVYSLKEDLYNKRAFKGDFHIHTQGSDGRESAELTAANYRKWGYDTLCITDHLTMEPSLRLREYLKDVNTDLYVFPGEEVHQPFPGGSFHMVNLDGNRSVNEILLNDTARADAEIKAIADTMPFDNAEDRWEMAWYKWVGDEIRKTGGLAVYPHPFWDIFGGYNIRTKTSAAILKNNYCDVFELMGGTCDKEANRRQVQFYCDMVGQGVKKPIVGATDSHGSLRHGLFQFDQVWNIALAEKAEDVPESILEGYVAVVDNYVPSDKNVYGPLRIVEYVWFLLDNYYEKHDELCSAIGQAMQRYVYGDKSQNQLILMLENELRKYNDEFFGKR